MRLDGKVAVVTGGARGIGRAVCERYAKEGARVVVADLAEQEAREVAGTLGGGALGVALDVMRQDSIDRMVETVVGQAGGIDVLVNNAGVFTMAPLLEITRESYRKTFAVNGAADTGVRRYHASRRRGGPQCPRDTNGMGRCLA